MGHNVYNIWTKLWLMIQKKKLKIVNILLHDLKLWSFIKKNVKSNKIYKFLNNSYLFKNIFLIM